MTDQYTSKDVCAITECSHRQLQYWEKKEYISPEKGNRNIRIYNDNDIKIIKQIINLKKKGSSLGEAFIRSSATVRPNSAIITNTNFILLKEAEDRFIALNEELLSVLFKINELSDIVPGYPYSAYNEDALLKLKELQDKASTLKSQKNEAWEKINTIINADTALIKKAKQAITKPRTDNKYNINQLILLWIRKNGSTENLDNIREKYIERVRNGESIDALVQELQIQPEKSK